VAGSLYASIRPRSVEDITVNGYRYRIPALPAAAWLDVMLSDVMITEMFTSLLAPVGHDEHPASQLEEAMLFGGMTDEQVRQLAHDIIDINAARPWYVARRLIDIAADEVWGDYIRGQIVLHRLDADAISLAAWLDAVYAILTTGLSADRRQQFDIQLSSPPAGEHMSPEARKRNLTALQSLGG